MKNFALRSLLLITVAGLVGMLLTTPANAKGRTGSRRTYSGHGKGSHYKGGMK